VRSWEISLQTGQYQKYAQQENKVESTDQANRNAQEKFTLAQM
jgi:hypothetical protein